MHGLYLEFARALIQREGNKERGWWLGHVEKNFEDILQLKRLVMAHTEFKLYHVPENLQEC